MADIELSALPDAGAVLDDDLLLLSRAGAGKRASGSRFVRSAAGFSPRYVSGRFYASPLGASVTPNLNIGASGSGYFMTLRLATKVTISDLAAVVTTASAGVSFTLAIYASTADGLPGVRLGVTPVLSGAAVGAVSGALAAALTLDPGIYFLGIAVDGGTLKTMFLDGASINAAALIGIPTLGQIPSGNLRFGYRVPLAAGAWPADATSNAVDSFGFGEPAILFRVA